MLLQAVIVMRLETPEYFYIGPLDLSITLWMHYRCIADLDAKVFTVFLKYPIGELEPIVSDDPVRDPKPADN
jgi:hypothetical protein